MSKAVCSASRLACNRTLLTVAVALLAVASSVYQVARVAPVVAAATDSASNLICRPGTATRRPSDASAMAAQAARRGAPSFGEWLDIARCADGLRSAAEGGLPVQVAEPLRRST